MEFQFIHRDVYPEADGEFPNETVNTKTVRFSDGTTWCKVMDEFISFIGSVYGYDIRDKVKYKSLADKLAELSEEYDLDTDVDAEDLFDKQGREFN